MLINQELVAQYHQVLESVKTLRSDDALAQLNRVREQIRTRLEQHEIVSLELEVVFAQDKMVAQSHKSLLDLETVIERNKLRSRLVLSNVFFHTCARAQGDFSKVNLANQKTLEKLASYLRDESLSRLIYFRQGFGDPIPLEIIQEEAKNRLKKMELRFRMVTGLLGVGTYGEVFSLDFVIKTDTDYKILTVTPGQKVWKLYKKTMRTEHRAREPLLLKALAREQSFKRHFLEDTSKVRSAKNNTGLVLSRLPGVELFRAISMPDVLNVCNPYV